MLDFYGVPIGLKSFILGLYRNVVAFYNVGAGYQFLFTIRCGVIQGDPLSGLLFAMCSDSMAHMFDAEVVQPGFGIMKMCADDVGAVVKSCLALLPLEKCYSVIEAACGLKLRYSKCHIIPVSCPYSDELALLIRDFIAANVANWTHMN
eukprot:8272755-Karenia_brevis.AAC.1